MVEQSSSEIERTIGQIKSLFYQDEPIQAYDLLQKLQALNHPAVEAFA